VAFTSEFYDDVNKKRQWTAFCAKNKSYIENVEFKAVMEAIRDFLALPHRTRGKFVLEDMEARRALALKQPSMRFVERVRLRVQGQLTR
jgi:hypothetical protein